MLHLEDITREIIAGAIEVHQVIGPGLLESAYEACLVSELGARGLRIRRQVILPVVYKGLAIDCGYRIDAVVDDCVVLELKCVTEVTDLHKAQLLTYLKLSGHKVGLLLNFNVPLMKQGIHRMVV